MVDIRRIAEAGLGSLVKAGADKAQCSVAIGEKHEMNIESGELNLLRTTFDTSIGLTAIKDNKKGSSGINKTDRDSIDKAASEVMELADASKPDDAYDIAEFQDRTDFKTGPESPDLDHMYTLMSSMTETIKARYPKILLANVHFFYYLSKRAFYNSNGVALAGTRGQYHLSIGFSAKDGDKVSSINGTGFSMTELDRELIEYAMLDELLRQSSEQIVTTPLEGKFTGDIIVTPDCMGAFIGFINGALSDYPLIAGTSVYKDSLDRAIAGPLFNLHSMPLSDRLASGYWWTSDGYLADNLTLVDKGVLKSYLLGLYGSKKTGRQRSVNNGGSWIVDPGQTSYKDMIRSVKRGILLSSFAGGHPSDNGDFSGVAKNSYYIEDGEIKYPVSESMISGNIVEALRNITAISKETISDGYQIMPWVSISGITISGK